VQKLYVSSVWRVWGKLVMPMMKWRNHMRVEPGNITLDDKGT